MATTQVLTSGSGSPFALQVAKGELAGQTPFYKYGSNLGVGTSFEVVWSNGGTLNYLTVATVMQVSSSNVNDTAAGTGARTVTLVGLDASYNEISETVTLNGQTPVPTVKAFLRLYRAFLVTAGSGETNAGIIYAGTGAVVAGVPAVVYTQIEAGVGQTLQAFYTVPAGYTLYLSSVEYGSSNSANNFAEFQLRTRAPNGPWLVKHTSLVKDAIDDHVWEYPFVIPEKTDIEVRARASGSTINTQSDFQGILIQGG